jgi:mRNA interferase MazF
MYQRGDIVLVPFPFADLSTTKLRSGLVISNDVVNATGDVIIVMVTSQNKNDSFQIEINASDVVPSLPKTSYVRCHRISTIDSAIIVSLISRAGSGLLTSVQNKIFDLVSA